jgi:hypothetical protein
MVRNVSDFIKPTATEHHNPQVGMPKSHSSSTLTEEEERELNELLED